MADVITEAKRIRAGVLKRDARQLKRVLDQYRVLYDRLKGDIAALEAELAKKGALTAGQVKQLKSYRRLMQDIRREMDDYTAWLRGEIAGAGKEVITAGIKDARALLGAQDARLLAVFRTLNPAQLEQLMAFLDPAGALYQGLAKMGEESAKAIAAAILKGVALGQNPNTIAKMISSQLGMELVSAMRTMRTVQMYAYREANRASYIANADVVEGWEWIAELDDSTCMACLSLHGTTHPLDEVQDGHWNCRCTMVPVVIGSEGTGGTGEDWFKSQPEDVQRNIMGDARYEAWKDGKFAWGDMAQERDDPVFGQMKTETPLKDLVKEE